MRQRRKPTKFIYVKLAVARDFVDLKKYITSFKMLIHDFIKWTFIRVETAD